MDAAQAEISQLRRLVQQLTTRLTQLEERVAALEPAEYEELPVAQQTER